jgi:hypothetical protein
MSHAIATYEVSVQAASPPKLTTRVQFDFGGYLPLGDGFSLPIHANPPLVLDLARQEVEVEGWGVRTPITGCHDIPRQMSRLFLRLWNGSQAGTLKLEDQNTWDQIVDQVDYQAFCADHSLPRWVDGVLIHRDDTGVRVRWVDNKVDKLSGDCASALTLVDVGEAFRALVRYGRDACVRALSDAVPLGNEEDLINQLLAESWTVA